MGVKSVADGKVVIDVILDDKQVGGGIKKVEGRLSGIAGAAKRGIASVGKLATVLGVVALAYKGIDMVKQSLDGAIDRYDTLNNFPRVMEQIGFDAETSQKAIDKLSDGIQGLPTRLDEVASTAQNIAIMTGDLDGAVDTTLALNNAFLASGASTADAERGLQQYVQMLSKGEVDLQSWRTLQETMPYALRETAEALGFTGESATNDFYDALKAGDITMSEFNDKLIELDQAQGGFADTAQTASGGIKTAWTNMKTWVVMGVADILEAIDDALGGTGSIEGAINALKRVVQGVFGWIANTAIPAVANAIKFLIDIFYNAKEAVVEWVGDNESGLSSLWEFYQQYLGLVWEYVQEVFNFISEIVQQVLPPVAEFIGGILEQIVTFFSENGEQILEAVRNVFEFIKSIVEFIMPVVGFIVKDVWNAIKNVIQGAINIILGIVKTFAALFTGDWSGMWEGIKQLLLGVVQALWGLINLWFVGKILKLGKTFFNLFRGLFTNGFNAIRSFVTSSLNSIRSSFTNVFNRLKGIVTSALNGVRSAVSNGIKGALNVVTNMGKSFFNAGKNIVTSIANGIKNAIGAVTSAISSVTSKIRAFLPFSPAKEGPLRDLNKLDFGGPIEDSLKKAIPNVQAELQALLNIGGPETVLATPEPSYVDVGGTYEFTIVSEIDSKTLAKETVVLTAEEV